MSYLIPLAVTAIVLFSWQHASASSPPDITIETSFFKYGDQIPYKVKMTHAPDSDDHLKFRFINNETRFASDWSNLVLQGSPSIGTIPVVGPPFDKKGAYVLQFDYFGHKTGGGGYATIQLLDDANQTSQGTSHLLSPRQQILTQYVSSDIKCKTGLSLEQRTRNGDTVCVKPENKAELLKRGYLHDPAKDPDGLMFDGLRHTYDESEPLNFAVWYKGETTVSCFYPKIRITNDLGQRAWSNDPNDIGCVPDTKRNIDAGYGVNQRNFDHPVLSAGKYTITAQFEGQQISQDITVKKLY